MALNWTDHGNEKHSATADSGKEYKIELEDKDTKSNPKQQLVVRSGYFAIAFADDVADAQAKAQAYEAKTARAQAWEQYMRNNDPPGG